MSATEKVCYKNMEHKTPDFNRVIKTMHHEEPDRVPLAEVAVDYEIMTRFLGKEVKESDLAAQVEFWTTAGYDFLPLTVGMMQPGEVTQESQISKVIQRTILKGTGQEADDEAWNVLRRPLIRNEQDFDSFPWEEAAKLDLRKLWEVQPYLPSGMKVVAASGKIFTLAWMLMGFENLAVSLLSNPRLVAKVIDKVAQIQLAGVRQITGIPNIGGVWAVDDLAFRSGPIVSPKAFREFVFPWYEELGNLCSENGLCFIFHTDGLVWDLIEDLIAVGVNALHPIDPTCMDIEEVKDRVGERVGIIGNISNELLQTGTPQEVTDLTKARLRRIAPGGGYCLGAGNSIPNWARIENYRAMIETGLRFGTYPIRID